MIYFLWGNYKNSCVFIETAFFGWIIYLNVRITNEISEPQLQNVFNVSEYRSELCAPKLQLWRSCWRLTIWPTVPKNLRINVLFRVCSASLSCARSKLLKFKFAQGIYVHPLCVCVCVCVCVRARCIYSAYKTCAFISKALTHTTHYTHARAHTQTQKHWHNSVHMLLANVWNVWKQRSTFDLLLARSVLNRYLW